MTPSEPGRREKAKQQYSFDAVVTRHTVVTVEASNEQEARELAEAGDWVEESMGSLSDFRILKVAR